MSIAHDAALRRVVIGVDGSERSRDALRWGSRLAHENTEVEAVIAWEYPLNYALSNLGTEPWTPEARATELLDTALNDVFGARTPPNVKAVVREGQAVSVLLAASSDADLLVVGGGRHGSLASTVTLGSVSAACAERAQCSVLVAHRSPV